MCAPQNGYQQPNGQRNGQRNGRQQHYGQQNYGQPYGQQYQNSPTGSRVQLSTPQSPLDAFVPPFLLPLVKTIFQYLPIRGGNIFAPFGK